jgi:hypothetical protein
MTVIDLPRTQSESTPQSQDLESLQAMLDDPMLVGFHDQIRESIRKLTATTVLAA